METGKDCAQFSFLAFHPFRAHTSFKLMFNTQQPPLSMPPTPTKLMLSHSGPSSHPNPHHQLLLIPQWPLPPTPTPSVLAHVRHTVAPPSQPHPFPLSSRSSHSGPSLSTPPPPSQLTFITQWPLPLNPTPSVLAHVRHTVAPP